jgi:2,3-bisphosphoglycerate-dependent phosphoglycerate mutase
MTDQRPRLYQFTLLRHGQSVGNAEGRHQGQFDYPLTPTGIEQAQVLARCWEAEGRHFDAILSSPLQRARQTAEIVAVALKSPVEFDPIWMERDNGVLAGLSHAEAAENHPRPPFIHPYQPVGRTGEGIWALYLRAGQAVQGLVRRPPGSYLVVSHGGLLNMVLYAVLGIVPQANFHGARFRFRNTAYAVLFYDPAQHEWLLDRLNERSHWRAGRSAGGRLHWQDDPQES